MRAFVDTNVVVRHLTQDPREQGLRATAFLVAADLLHLADVVVAEIAYVLQSVYGASRADVAQVVRATLEFPAIELENRARLLRALDVYERECIDFADAYLVACAEASAVRQIASFDRSLDRVESVTRVEP